MSRSFLQNDGYVKKISAHITKKVADKLTGMFATDRKTYEGYWNDIAPFVKYGCMKDNKFFDSVKNVLLLRTTKDEYLTLRSTRPERGQTRRCTTPMIPAAGRLGGSVHPAGH